MHSEESDNELSSTTSSSSDEDEDTFDEEKLQAEIEQASQMVCFDVS